MKIPISGLLAGVIAAMTASSLYTFWDMFKELRCDPDSPCLRYSLKNRPEVQLAVFTSGLRNPWDRGGKRLIMNLSPFNYEEAFENDVNISLPNTIEKTKQRFLHAVILSPGYSVKEWKDVYKSTVTALTSIPLLDFRVPAATTYDIFKNESSQTSPIWHFKKSVAFTVLIGLNEISLWKAPLELKHFVRNTRGVQQPILHYNVLHERMSDLTPLKNESVTIKVHYQPSTCGQFRLMIHFEEMLNGLVEYRLSESDVDQIKGILSGTHFYLLMTTIVVSSLHLIFEFMAFKSDVAFWKDRESLAGISPRTVLWRAVSQTVILAYLFDATTSYLIVVPALISTGIEWWKVYKMRISPERSLRKRTRQERITEELDAEGIKYLYYVCLPVCLIGAWYSLVYLPHRGWYSWALQSLANGVYAFGFLLMLPQIFINYKLKSVDHMPWKKFMYKAINTFIDDLFAFLIEMPATHRLACFRDDVIFFIYLYQRWLYPVDKGRGAEDVNKVDFDPCETSDDVKVFQPS